MEYPQRKNIRIDGYDYATAGAYFITVCTANREKLFWDNVKSPCNAVGADSIRPQDVPLSPIGSLVEDAISQISEHYEHISVDNYCIMPDHVHILLRIDPTTSGVSVGLSTVIGSLKRWVSRQAGRPIWQKSYFDHVIRGQRDYNEIWQYIEENPLKYLSTGG